MGEAFAKRGETKKMCLDVTKGKPQHLRLALLKGYDEVKHPSPKPPPGRRFQLQPIRKKAKKRKPVTADEIWLDGIISQQRTQTLQIINFLKEHRAPNRYQLYGSYFGVGETGVWKRPTWPTQSMSELAGKQFRERIQAIGFTPHWFGVRNGIHERIIIELCKSEHRIPRIYEQILDREELMWELSALIENRVTVRTDDVYKILRKRFEKLP